MPTKDKLKVGVVQLDLSWENKPANLAKIDQILDDLAQDTDFVLLPEMFSTGFSMRPDALAEPISGPTVQWLRDKAQALNVAIGGSLIINENGQHFNRFLWAEPDGKLLHYDKRHLFSMAGEQNHYTAGTQQLRITYKGWRLAAFVCYDLRFPTWCRNTDDYDAAIFVANWPDRRSAHWRALLQARAIENQAYILAANRVGNDGNGIAHSGYSSAIAPDGEKIFEIANLETIAYCQLEREHLSNIRERLPFLKDRD